MRGDLPFSVVPTLAPQPLPGISTIARGTCAAASWVIISGRQNGRRVRPMFPVRLSIVTYNLWGSERWPERAPALRRFCETYRPDIMGVQELTADSRAVIDEALPHHARVDDDLTGWTTEGNLWWNTGFLELVDHGAEDVGFEVDQDRRLFWVRLRVEGRPRTLWIGDIHLTAPDTREELDEGHSSRVREIKRVIEALRGLVAEDEPAFLIGDFADALVPLIHLFGNGYSSCFAKLDQIPPPTMPSFGESSSPTASPPASSSTGLWPTTVPAPWRHRHPIPMPMNCPRPTTGRSKPSTSWRSPSRGRSAGGARS